MLCSCEFPGDARAPWQHSGDRTELERDWPVCFEFLLTLTRVFRDRVFLAKSCAGLGKGQPCHPAPVFFPPSKCPESLGNNNSSNNNSNNNNNNNNASKPASRQASARALAPAAPRPFRFLKWRLRFNISHCGQHQQQEHRQRPANQAPTQPGHQPANQPASQPVN